MADVFRILDLPPVPDIFVKECLDAVYDRLGLDIIQQKGGFSDTNQDGTFKFSELKEAPDPAAYRKYVDNYQNTPKFVQWHDNTQRRICAIKRFPFSADLMTYVRENIFSGIDEIPLSVQFDSSKSLIKKTHTIKPLLRQELPLMVNKVPLAV